jgi:hypothetical protein
MCSYFYKRLVCLGVMKTLRGICDWRNGEGLIQRAGSNVFISGGKGFIVKNPSDVPIFFDRRGSDKESLLENGHVYQFGFESGTRWYDGFRLGDELENGYIRKRCLPDNHLYDTFMSLTDIDTGSSLELSIGEGFDISLL